MAEPPEEVTADPGPPDQQHAVAELLEQALVDAYGDGEQLRALRQAFEDGVALPADAFVIGEPVVVAAFDFDGNERRGLTATCRREDGSEHVVSASEVAFAPGSAGELHVAAYRTWLGLAPVPAAGKAGAGRRAHRATAEDLDLGSRIELVVLAVMERVARCRLAGGNRVVTLRASGLWQVVPGHIVTIRPRKQWRYGNHPYLSGEIEATRIDAEALGLVPLRLASEGFSWDPEEHYWGEPDDPVEEWAVPIIARGPRPLFEMEQVVPGTDPNDPESDPIMAAIELSAAEDPAGARDILMNLCQADLRCLDAHAHLGNAVFDHMPAVALQHYEVGVRIGELALGARFDRFDGVLSWGLLDNRPFLRCLHGYGLSLWRLNRTQEAAAVFERMLWLNPTDNQGMRFLVAQLEAGESWTPDR